MTTFAFASLALQPELLDNLSTLGYNEMTEIQAAALPKIIVGQDVIAQAKTGSGKTAAFGLGLLQKLEVERFRIQALILCPTRELADQVAEEIRRLARGMHNVKILTLCGGQPFGPQAHSLEHGAHIIVGTPGRIEDHLSKGNLKLENVDMLVLDEADRMLDMGFQETLDTIVEQLPKQRQTLLFSATFPDKITSLAGRLLKDPQQIKVESSHASSSIKQHFYKLNNETERFTALRLLLLHYAPESSVVFCTTRKETQDLADGLSQLGFSAQALHGDMEQKDRERALIKFSNGSSQVLLATDLAARGLDIPELDYIIHYDLPYHAEEFTHRNGRTARVAAKGTAYVLTHTGRALPDFIAGGEALTEFKTAGIAKPFFKTLFISGGRKDKISKGDIAGVFIKKGGLTGTELGLIELKSDCAFVAVPAKKANELIEKLNNTHIKKRKVRIYTV